MNLEDLKRAQDVTDWCIDAITALQQQFAKIELLKPAYVDENLQEIRKGLDELNLILISEIIRPKEDQK